jgi:AhpD family alkylhydroperoxidase
MSEEQKMSEVMGQPRLKYGQLVPEGLARMTALEHYLNTDAGLETSLRGYVRLLASLLNGCEFCIRLHTAELRQAGEPEAKISGVLGSAESSLFTPRERAALAWTKALTNIQDGHAPDAIYKQVRAQFSEVETVNLTLTITTINAWNRISIALGRHSSRE